MKFGMEEYAIGPHLHAKFGLDRRVNQNDIVQTTEVNGESTSMVWPTLGSRTAKEQNRTVSLHWFSRFMGVSLC